MSMPNRLIPCAVCGMPFLPVTANAKYCSHKCAKRADRKRQTSPHRTPVEGDIILREFYCSWCGHLVEVVEETDKRTVFCCCECERKYWKRPPERRRGSGNNRGLSGGMSLGSLIRREKRNLSH